ncbi:hypothetical protein CONLIGDRAFT_692019 [Coniochaeta ligniaria NRRL 30616]|uniref:DUF7702 domain-containing protein n=1 Tax=Coniochaeta ligniaria NRRL 30616 TaxID=1408157 RepID=A0A1J7JAL4_9PEZI|nr:hypothetical protein CONLIGDRAFT_692019 [Coniochaeta ligniaria NRRL 30616]
MGAITAENVAIAELVVYIPTALLTVWVVFRHGVHKQLGWIYLAIFSGIRIAGSAMEIQSAHNPSDTTSEEWALILQSVGLSPLLLSTLGLLKRVGRIYTKRATATSRRSRAVQLLHIPALIGLILAISGGTDEASDNASDHAGGQTKVRVAVVLFLLIFLAALLLWAVTLRDFRNMQAGQTRIYLCVMVAMPLIAVRLLYSLISNFGNSPQFSLIHGDEAIRLGMASVEEFLVVIMYTILGVFTPRFVGVPEANGRGSVEEVDTSYGPTYQVEDEERVGSGRGHGRHGRH